ncbi:CWF19-like protein 2 [Rhynchospora pubera]|uniref:CWF19-like protein 2 n=1 Tax=Rhynchospora pubera TaxID=906938 RepID=A0AAV8CG83_9POAL|nr:CWF19-like protein 2 [Rhynchospora pubera]
MLSGIKFVPKDKLRKGGSADSDSDRSDDKWKKDLKRKKEKRRGKKKYSSDEESSSSEEEEKISKRRKGREKRDKRKKRKYSSDDSDEEEETEEMTDLAEKTSSEIVRKEMGLEWMLKSAGSREKNPRQEEKQEEEPKGEEARRSNPKELNPYLKDNGDGYPDEEKSSREGDTFLASSVVGDGGASWRMKALRRAKEQAAREGRKLEEVVGERWSSLGDLAASVVNAQAAPSRAHLRAIRDRKAGQSENPDDAPKKHESRDYLRGVSSRQSEMRRPRQESNLSWRRNKGNSSQMSSENKALVSEAIGGINKFDNDGSFLEKIRSMQKNAPEESAGLHGSGDEGEQKLTGLPDLDPSVEGMTANQVAAEVLKLRLKGKHEEADRLSKQVEAMAEKKMPVVNSVLPKEVTQGQSARHYTSHVQGGKKRREDDSDMHLARSIMQNKKYSSAGSIEDEYDYDGVAPSKKKGKKRGGEGEAAEGRGIMGRQMLTHKERCLFCFENPSRPKHLVVSIANFTYLMLPQWQAVVPGHCIILPLQHEAAARNIDNNVWEEIRNFKKCLLRMFAKQEKDVVFLETAIGFSKQRRHCLIECIPIPSRLSNAAPMYFKKAIDEAEDEWAQHDAKKLIPTSGNLRQVIPANFAYFHVEFGLDRGFVHVIDDEANFSSGFGLNVIRGMLELPEEDMHRKRRYETVENQKQAVASFAREWEPFDWTRQLD